MLEIAVSLTFLCAKLLARETVLAEARMRFLFKCLFFNFALFPVSASADNEWVLVAQSVEGSEYFVYMSEVMDAGDLLYVKTLANYSERQDTGEMSSVSDEIISCPQNMTKTTRMSTYSEKGAAGTKLGEHDLVAYEMDFWQSAQPGSITYIYIERLCSHFGK